MKTLQDALKVYTKVSGRGLNEIQDLYCGARAKDYDEASCLAGKIYTVFMYEHFLDHLFDNYGFVPKSFVEKELRIKMSDAKFDEWVVSNVEWFQDNQNIPDRAQDLVPLMAGFQEELQNRMKNERFVKSALKDAGREIVEVNRAEFMKGMQQAIDWIAITIVPAVFKKPVVQSASAMAVKFKMPGPGLS